MGGSINYQEPSTVPGEAQAPSSDHTETPPPLDIDDAASTNKSMSQADRWIEALSARSLTRHCG